MTSIPAVLEEYFLQGQVLCVYVQLYCSLLYPLQLIYFRAWMATVPSTLSGLSASLLVRDPKSKRLRVNYDPRIREMLHEAEYLMKLNLDIGSLALNLCMDEDRLKTTNDKSVPSVVFHRVIEPLQTLD